MKAIKMLALTKYGRLGASSRMRSLQYLPWLQQADIQVTVQPFISDELLHAKYERGRYGRASLLHAYVGRLRTLMRRHQFDFVWIEKESLPWWPLWLELALLRGVPFILDFDDAVFHNYDRNRLSFVRRMYGRRLDGLMAKARLVVAGNGYLAERASQSGALWVEVVPTVVDLERYPPQKLAKASSMDGVPRIVWIGTPATVHYLQLLREPLRILSQRVPFLLRVIGGGGLVLPGVNVEVLPWMEASEVQSIAAGDIGVMPLFDSPWERGKCGYKLIQYMACHLPVVASGVGVNTQIVQDGASGFLAHTNNEWVIALERLLRQPELRERMGAAGRARVETKYCIQQTGPKMAGLLKIAAQRT